MDPLTGFAIAGPLAGIALAITCMLLGWHARGRAEAGWDAAESAARARLEAELADALARARAVAAGAAVVVSLERALGAAAQLGARDRARRLLQLGDDAGFVAAAGGPAGANGAGGSGGQLGVERGPGDAA